MGAAGENEVWVPYSVNLTTSGAGGQVSKRAHKPGNVKTMRDSLGGREGHLTLSILSSQMTKLKLRERFLLELTPQFRDEGRKRKRVRMNISALSRWQSSGLPLVRVGKLRHAG